MFVWWVPSRPQGLWAASVLGSSLHFHSCYLSRCQNPLLRWGLNFWKPIKMCLLWWDQDFSPDLVAPSLPLDPMGLDLSGSWGWEDESGGWRQSYCVLCLPLAKVLLFSRPS